MTKERARWLVNNTGQFGALKWAFDSPLAKPPYCTGDEMLYRTVIDPQGITPQEFEYIKMYWSLMDNQTSFFGAINKIAGGV